MRYKVIPDEDFSDSMFISVDKMATKSGIAEFDHRFDKATIQNDLVGSLFMIDGIEQIYLTTWTINIIKGSVFDWKEMMKEILKTIHSCLDPKGPFIEKTSRKKGSAKKVVQKDSVKKPK